MYNLFLVVLMIAALAGMMFCGRLRQKRPALQVIAFLLLLLVLVSGALFLSQTGTLRMLGFSDAPGMRDDSARKLAHARACVLANYISTAYPENKNILLIGRPGIAANSSSLCFELAQRGITGVTVEEIVPAVGESDNLITDAADRAAEGSAIDSAIDRHPEAAIVILVNITPTGESIRRLKVYRMPDDRRPQIIVLGLNRIGEWVADALQRGIFSAIIVTDLTKTADAFDKQLSDDPVEVFDSRYILITRDNLKRYRRFFH